MNAGWDRSNSRSRALLWFAVTTSGLEKLTLTLVVRLPLLPVAP